MSHSTAQALNTHTHTLHNSTAQASNRHTHTLHNSGLYSPSILVACSDFQLPVARTGIRTGIIGKTEIPPDFC